MFNTTKDRTTMLATQVDRLYNSFLYFCPNMRLNMGYTVTRKWNLEPSYRDSGHL
jgi:hypothetical protein